MQVETIPSLKRASSDGLEGDVVIKKRKYFEAESPILPAQDALKESNINDTENVKPLNNVQNQNSWFQHPIIKTVSNFATGWYNTFFHSTPNNVSDTSSEMQIEWNSGIYKGETKNGKPEGKGKYSSALGIYEGQFINGHFNGKGKYTDLNSHRIYKGEFNIVRNGPGKEIDKFGNIFKGVWKNNQVLSIRKVTFTDGTMYKGFFRDKSLNGRGQKILPNNTIYEGNFQDGRLNGYGKKIDILGKLVHSGMYLDGYRHGQGAFHFKGSKYIGEFYLGKMQGQGEFINSKGYKFSGEFINNCLEGQGLGYDMNGKLRYKGEFHLSLFHGFGTKYYVNGETYIGQFQSGKKQGHGELTKNGFVFKGHFDKGFLNGKGFQTGINGELIYEGEFKSGQSHGYGTYYFDDGSSYQGTFYKGALTGYGRLQISGGYVQEGEFLEGYLVKGKLFNSKEQLLYKGEFKSDRPDGLGTKYFDNGDVYSGNFLKGEITGYGILTTQYDFVFEGQFLNGKLNGEGVAFDPQGDPVYEGGYVNGTPHGRGKYHLPEGGYCAGKFSNGSLNCGKRFYLNGDSYNGELKDFLPHGKGVALTKEHRLIIGSFENGFPCNEEKDLT